MLTTTGMVFRAIEEKENGRPSPGEVLVARTGAITGVWKMIAAKTNEPMAADIRAPKEYLFCDIGSLLFLGFTLSLNNISDLRKSFKPRVLRQIKG